MNVTEFAVNGLLDDRKAFQEWLEKQSPMRRFRRREVCLCPFAQYLQDTTGKVVTAGRRSTILDDVGYGTPRWAKQFITLVDDEQQWDREITATQALSTLRRVA